jgi:hypothetical protein
VSQHTPSTQWPDTHCVSPPHVAALPTFGVHTLPAQKAPFSQSASAWQSPRQAVVPHVKGAHFWSWIAPQWPLPPHVLASVATPSVQLAAWHVTLAPG